MPFEELHLLTEPPTDGMEADSRAAQQPCV
jgi:hypothetical protein